MARGPVAKAKATPKAKAPLKRPAAATAQTVRAKFLRRFGPGCSVHLLSNFEVNTFQFWLVDPKVTEVYDDHYHRLETMARVMPPRADNEREVLRLTTRVRNRRDMWTQGTIVDVMFVGTISLAELRAMGCPEV